MNGVIKWPMAFLNVPVSTTPAELGAWMKKNNLTRVVVYEKGWMNTYVLEGLVARQKEL